MHSNGSKNVVIIRLSYNASWKKKCKNYDTALYRQSIVLILWRLYEDKTNDCLLFRFHDPLSSFGDAMLRDAFRINYMIICRCEHCEEPLYRLTLRISKYRVSVFFFFFKPNFNPIFLQKNHLLLTINSNQIVR